MWYARSEDFQRLRDLAHEAVKSGQVDLVEIYGIAISNFTNAREFLECSAANWESALAQVDSTLEYVGLFLGECDRAREMFYFLVLVRNTPRYDSNEIEEGLASCTILADRPKMILYLGFAQDRAIR